MDVWTWLLIPVFQILNFAIADWNPLSPLILVDLPPYTTKRFPLEVHWSERFGIWYYDRYVKRNKREKIFAYCPDANSVYPKCNTSESFLFADYGEGHRLPATCDNEVEYDIAPILNQSEEHESCFHNGISGYKYKFVYWLCEDSEGVSEESEVNYERETIDVYEMCYHDEWNQIIIGNYRIQNPSLLEDELLKDEQEYSFEFNTQPDHNNFLNIKSLYHQSNDYVPRSVLPTEWLPFGHQRKPFFHFMNVAAMKTQLIQGWEILMLNLRHRLSQLARAIYVTAGLFDHLKREDGNREYLGFIDNVGQIPIAEVWWVLISNHRQTQGVAIIMHNKLYEENVQGPNKFYYNNERCSENVCYEANIYDLLPNIDDYPHNFIYCCHPNIIRSEFNLDTPPMPRILKFPDASEGPASSNVESKQNVPLEEGQVSRKRQGEGQTSQREGKEKKQF